MEIPGLDTTKKWGEHHLSVKSSRAFEPIEIRWIRRCLQRWPFKRGKGLLLRLFHSRLSRRDYFIEIEPGVLIPPELDDWMVLSFFTDGCHNNLPFRLSRSLIRAGDVLMDVGANVGLWAMGAARRVGAEGTVHTFEPVPDNFARLTRNVAINGLTQIKSSQVALSDKCGHTPFYMATDNNSGLGSLIPRDEATRAIEIEMTTIDDYCNKHDIARIDLLKVDVEGAEELVFRGAERLLSSAEAPVILFETDEALTSRFLSSSRSVKASLSKQGYNFFRFDGTKLEVVPAAETHHKQEDLFALKPFHFEKYALLRQLLG